MIAAAAGGETALDTAMRRNLGMWSSIRLLPMRSNREAALCPIFRSTPQPEIIVRVDGLRAEASAQESPASAEVALARLHMATEGSF